jgi:hypothetical protein
MWWWCSTYISWSGGFHECPGRPYECEICGFAGSVNSRIMAVLVPTVVVVRSDSHTLSTKDTLANARPNLIRNVRSRMGRNHICIENISSHISLMMALWKKAETCSLNVISTL